MPQYESGDVYRDYLAPRAVTFQVAIQLVPLDLTGSTASFQITGIGNFAMTVQPATFGAFQQGGLSLVLSPAAMSAWVVGPYDYRILVTFPDGTVFPFGHGKVLVS